jgi:hypothetical protein
MWRPPENYLAAARTLCGGRQKNIWRPPDKIFFLRGTYPASVDTQYFWNSTLNDITGLLFCSL